MNELIDNLAKALRATDGGVKIIAGLVGLAIVAGVGLALHFAQDTKLDYAVFSNLTSNESTKVGKALSDEGIEFYASSPPGPYTIHVDEDNTSKAMAAAYGANALDKPLEGYQKEDGANIFLSSGEREANLKKARWQESERMLENFAFITSATVIVTEPGAKIMFDRKAEKRSAAVTLVLARPGMITDQQANSITQISQRALGVDGKDLTIADQDGNFIYDGAEDAKSGLVDKQLLKVQRDYDRTKTEELNAYLAGIYGPNMASIRVSSEWNWEKSAEQSTAATKGAVLEEDTTETERGVSEAVGGPAGMTSNAETGDYGVGTAATAAAAGGGPQSKSTEKNTRSMPTVTNTSKVRDQPEISRLSIVAVVTDSVVTAEDGTRNADLVTDLEEMIQTAAGFSKTRKDAFKLSFTKALYTPEVVVDENVEPPAEANTLMPILLRRGVEIVTALAFVFFLLKSLKSSKSESTKEIVAVKAENAADAVDPEALARAQIAELLETDPERVGSILANWARERPTVNS